MSSLRFSACFLASTLALAACSDGSSTPGKDSSTASDGPRPDGLVDSAPPAKIVGFERVFAKLAFARPVDIQHHPSDPHGLYVVEQAGRIQRVDREQQTMAPFLDIRDRVEDGGNEQGLLGLALHPNFDNNGQLFVNYTASGGKTVIARFQRQGASPGSADPASEIQLLTVNQPQSNHNGGGLAFGPDGKLYGGIGDGGGANDTDNNAQRRENLLGTIFRIDVDTSGGGKAYGIPTDNPFVGAGANIREEIWAYGLRNPWRIAFDSQTGWLWIGDVGQNAWEEIDIAKTGGLNFGWRIMEGKVCRPGGPANCDQQGLEAPVWVYPQDGASSITGGLVYRGEAIPALVGWYVYADAVTGELWRLRVDNGKTENVLIAKTDLFIVSFGEDSDGELYFADLSGGIYRLVAPK